MYTTFARALVRHAEAGEWEHLAHADRQLQAWLKGKPQPGSPGLDPAYDRLVQAHGWALKQLQQHRDSLRQAMGQSHQQREGLRDYHQTELSAQREYSTR